MIEVGQRKLVSSQTGEAATDGKLVDNGFDNNHRNRMARERIKALAVAGRDINRIRRTLPYNNLGRLRTRIENMIFKTATAAPPSPVPSNP